MKQTALGEEYFMVSYFISEETETALQSWIQKI